MCDAVRGGPASSGPLLRFQPEDDVASSERICGDKASRRADTRRCYRRIRSRQSAKQQRLSAGPSDATAAAPRATRASSEATMQAGGLGDLAERVLHLSTLRARVELSLWSLHSVDPSAASAVGPTHSATQSTASLSSPDLSLLVGTGGSVSM